MKRRSLGLLLALPLVGGCRPRERSAVLRGLVEEVVAKMARDLARQSRDLHLAAAAFEKEPSAATREEARRRFVGAALAWKRAQAFRSGPFGSGRAFQRAAFWPVSAAAIGSVLAAPTSDEPLVEGLGVEARGIWALEYLLFAPDSDAAIDDRFRRRYARALSANVLGYARRLSGELEDARGFARSFADGGAGSVAAVCVQSVDTLEILRGKLERAGRTPPELAVEGYYSRTSTDVALALLTGTESLYRGALEELATRVDARVAARVRPAFARLHERVRALGPRLEVASATRAEALRSAVAALAELKHVYEVELRSVLDA